ncbi:MAG: pantoate--beta-alanine ligase [Bacteroidetes bacterium]|nr:pantoate--beta-alanine ligase [Bacteroidota bacterium]
MESKKTVRVLKSAGEMQAAAEKLRHERKKIAVVPTMGYLHRGHASLIERAGSLADIVIVTVFVNPAQFAPNEDYARYPRDFEHDKAIIQAAGADIIFYPDVKEMYPDGFGSYVEVEKVTKILEGKFRPEHFKGVTTVVAKLLNITKPHAAVFGQKDAQQAFVIQKMIKDLNFDVQIILAPIVREEDGLAMSSRNSYLNEAERKNALVLFRSLQYAEKQIRQGEKSVELLREEMMKIILSGNPTQVDYTAFIDPVDFSETDNLNQSEILVALAVRFGTTRLIDNIIIPINS